MTAQVVSFAFAPGDIVRHTSTQHRAVVKRKKVRSSAPGKLEASYVLEIIDGPDRGIDVIEAQSDLVLVTLAPKR